MPAIAITGSTGRLGGRVAERLSRAGAEQRLLVRDLSRAPSLPGAHPVVADYADTEAVAAALTGCPVVLMVSAAETPDRVEQHKSFIDAAVASGVDHLVYTSFFGAGPDATFTLARDHWATEEHIKDRGLGHTFLRDNLYGDFTPLLVGADGILRGPAGQGRAAVVAIDDVADVATAVLREPAGHQGATYELTGPEALTLDEVAETITRVTGRQVRYEPETLEQAYASRADYGAPPWQVEAWVSTYTAIAAGELERVSSRRRDPQRSPGYPAG